MSQVKVDELDTWSKEDCKANFDTAFSELLKKLQSSSNPSTVFGLIFSKLLPTVQLQDFEDIFCKLLQSTFYKKLLQSTVVLITEYDRRASLQESLVAVLQDAMQTISAVQLFLTHLCQENHSDFNIKRIKSLFLLTSDLIKNSYEHCRDSGKIYGNYLHQVADELSCLFKKVHSLQMALLALLDKCEVTASDNDGLNCLCSILMTLHEISITATALDVKVTIALWKCISRLISQNKDVLTQQMDFSALLQSICDDISNSCAYLQEYLPSLNHSESSASLIKSVKVLGFQLRIVTKLVEDVGSNFNSTTFCMLYGISSDCMTLLQNAYKQNADNINSELLKQVFSGLQSLYMHLTNIGGFVSFELDGSHSVDEFPAVHQLTILLLTMKTTFQNPHADLPISSIISHIFNLVSTCQTSFAESVKIPCIMENTNGTTWSLLYREVFIAVCEALKHCNCDTFEKLEKLMWENFLSDNFWQSLLAVDVICFLCNSDNVDIQINYCSISVQLLKESPQDNCLHWNIVALLNRVIRRLNKDGKTWFLQKYLSSDYLWLWQFISCHCLSPDVSSKLLEMALGYLQNFQLVQDLEKQHLEVVVTCVRNAIKHLHHLSGSRSQVVCTICGDLWNCCKNAPDSRDLVIVQGILLEIFAIHCQELDVSLLESILQYIVSILTIGNANDYFLYMANEFTLQLSLQENAPQVVCNETIRNMLIRCYQLLLSTQNPMLRFCAVEKFAMFAESTQHEEIVAQCLSENTEIRDQVVEFLQCIETGSIGHDATHNLALEIVTSLESIQDSRTKEEVMTVNVGAESESQSLVKKRKSKEHGTDIEKAFECLDKAQMHLRMVAERTADGKLPKSVLEQLSKVFVSFKELA